MSIKQERITEPRVIAIRSWVQCDGCGSKMDERIDPQNPNVIDQDAYTPYFDLAPGWIQVVKGAHTTKHYAHACGKCLGDSVGALIGNAK